MEGEIIWGYCGNRTSYDAFWVSCFYYLFLINFVIWIKLEIYFDRVLLLQENNSCVPLCNCVRLDLFLRFCSTLLFFVERRNYPWYVESGLYRLLSENCLNMDTLWKFVTDDVILDPSSVPSSSCPRMVQHKFLECGKNSKFQLFMYHIRNVTFLGEVIAC